MSKIKEFYNEKIKSYSLGLSEKHIHQKIIGLVGKNQIILDVGCASGYLGPEIKKKGNKIFGVEISEKGKEEASKIFDEVILGNIEEIDLPYPEDYFDLIICADILEHLFDPKNVIMKLKKYLKDNGNLIVSLPNIANWWVRKELFFGRFEYQTIGLLDSGHIRFFTYESAKKMFKECGYKIGKFDLNVTLPPPLPMISRIFKFIPLFCKRNFFRLFGFQFLFILKKETGEQKIKNG